jgi:hypothetical protein
MLDWDKGQMKRTFFLVNYFTNNLGLLLFIY